MRTRSSAVSCSCGLFKASRAAAIAVGYWLRRGATNPHVTSVLQSVCRSGQAQSVTSVPTAGVRILNPQNYAKPPWDGDSPPRKHEICSGAMYHRVAAEDGDLLARASVHDGPHLQDHHTAPTHLK